MKLSVKKFSKKSLSLLIALIMVFSTMPFTAVTAQAAVSTLYNDRHGIVTNGDTSRWTNSKFNIVNDGESNNMSAGILHFDLTNYMYKKISNVTFNVAIESTSADTQIQYMNYYYSTTLKNDSTWLVAGGKETKNAGIGYGTGTTGVDTVLDNLGHNGGLLARTERTATSGSFDVTNTIKGLIEQGRKDLYIIVMHSNAGGTGSNSGWSDATVNPASIYFSIDSSDYDFSSVSGNKEYIEANISKFAMPTTQTVSYYGTDLGISNVLYTSNTYVDTANSAMTDFSLNQKLDDTKISAKLMAGVGRIVYMYTGDKTVAKIPLVYESKKNASTLQTYKYNYITSANSTWTFGNSDWKRSTAWNAWDTASGTMDGAYTVSSDSNHNVADFSDSNRTSALGDVSYDFHNIATYNGSVSFTNNYMKFNTTPSIDMSLDGYCYWTSGFWGTTKNYSYQNNITKNTTDLQVTVPTLSTPSNTSYSMIDFSGYNALVSNNTMKNKYITVKDNETKYTDDSLLAYYKAVANLVKFKTSNYDLSTDNGVSSCASNLATVVSAYNTANNGLEQKKATVTFTRTGIPTDIVVATIEVEPGNSIPDSKFPDLSKATYKSNNQHYEYFWQIEENYVAKGELTSSTKVDKDITVREVTKTVNCTIVNKGIEGDNVNLECSVCKNKSTLNASAYKAAVLAAQASIANSQAYSEDSRNALSSVLTEQDTAINKAKTQKEVDNCTSAIVSANQLKTENNPAGKLVYNQYSITVNYVDEKGAGLGTQEITNVNYGTIKEVTAETNFGNKSYVVYKWTRLTQDGDKLSGLNSTSVSVNVVRDLTYYVHLKSTQAESPDNTAVVTLNNKAGKPVDVGYVTTNEPQNVVVNGNSIKIGTDTTLTAPQYSFYSVKGFIVNNELITAQSGTKSITVTDDMTIIPLYDPTSYVNITRKSDETFTINGKNIDSYSARWDELITLETTGEVIWYTTKNGREVVLGQGKIFKFRANENIEIYTKQDGASPTINSRVGYFGYDADLKKVTIVNNFFVPGGANEDVKAGVVVSTKAKTRDEMIAQYNAGSLKFEGGYDKFTADKNQIRITINRNGSGDFSMWALSYVIVDGTTYFADDVISYTYNSPSKTA